MLSGQHVPSEKGRGFPPALSFSPTKALFERRGVSCNETAGVSGNFGRPSAVVNAVSF